MTKKICTIILNRNLPDVTDRLYEHLVEFDGDVTDICVVESGSDLSHISKYATWNPKEPDISKNGLRYCRGMNYGLSQLLYEGRFDDYEAFFLLANDTELRRVPSLYPLFEILENHPRVGILSPCSEHWGERFLLAERDTRYFWFIHNSALLIRKEFIKSICDLESANHLQFLFDGSNFRGYGSELEIIAKGYANDWASAITSRVWASENETYLLKQAERIKTDTYEENMRLYILEGKKWMKRKYGFNSQWAMQQYAKFFYDKFFEYHPECNQYMV